MTHSAGTVTYRYSLNSEAPAGDPIAVGTVLTFTPRMFGTIDLRVWDYDSAGNHSSTAAFTTITVSEAGISGRWGLDETSGTTRAADSACVVAGVSPTATAFTLPSSGTAVGQGAHVSTSYPGDAGVHFNGSAQAATSGSIPAPNGANQTVMAWVRLDSTAGTSTRRVAVSVDSGTGTAMSLGVAPDPGGSGTLRFLAEWSGTRKVTTAATRQVWDTDDVVELGTWYHLVGVLGRSGQDVTLYVQMVPGAGLWFDGDSHMWAPVTDTSFLYTSTQGPVRIGSSLALPATQGWVGDVDEVRVYPGVISDVTLGTASTWAGVVLSKAACQ